MSSVLKASVSLLTFSFDNWPSIFGFFIFLFVLYLNQKYFCKEIFVPFEKFGIKLPSTIPCLPPPHSPVTVSPLHVHEPFPSISKMAGGERLVGLCPQEVAIST